MIRNDRTPTPRARRIALSCGTAAGAALIAASISIGNAPAARADIIDADPVSDLVGAFDPNSFTRPGAPTDALGLLAYGLDTYLLGPSGLGDALDPTIDTWVGTVTVGPGPATMRIRSATWSGHSTPARLPPRVHRRTRLAFWPTTPTPTCWGPAALVTLLDPSIDSF